MPLIRIVRWWDNKTLHEVESVDLKAAVVDLVGRDADLGGADLGGADLRGADLRGADLGDADLRRIRDDVWAVLSSAPAEVPGLLSALAAGKVDGSTYQGDCACLVGTIAKVRGCQYDAIPSLTPDSGRLAEVWFTNIKPGDTPENSQTAKLAHEWIAEWHERMTLAFTPKVA